MSSEPVVIAVCGSMGSGKTTLCGHAADALLNCTVVCEDDFNRLTEQHPEEIDAWWNAGGDLGRLDLSAVRDSLQRSRREAGGQGLILFETQFGRTHPQLTDLITFQVLLEVPADLALARKIAQVSQQFGSMADQTSAQSGLQWIEQFCVNYTGFTRRLLETQREQLRKASDAVIDASGNALDVLRDFLGSLPDAVRARM